MANENRVGRYQVEVAYTRGAAARARVSQLAVQVLHTSTTEPNARVSQLAVQVLHTSPPPVATAIILPNMSAS